MFITHISNVTVYTRITLKLKWFESQFYAEKVRLYLVLEWLDKTSTTYGSIAPLHQRTANKATARTRIDKIVIETIIAGWIPPFSSGLAVLKGPNNGVKEHLNPSVHT